MLALAESAKPGLRFKLGVDGTWKKARAYGIQLNTWYHVAGVYDGSYVRIFLNGLEQEDKANTEGFVYEGNTEDVTIGCHDEWVSYPYYFNGLIDEVAIYDRALTAEEIQQHYWNGLHGQGYSAIELAVDIKPGSYPNAINLGSKGLIPVALLSSNDFDATTVDADTVELAGADVAVRGKGNKFMAHEEDVNADGLIDLVVHVATANLDPDSFQDGYAVLSATTCDGLPIWGLDQITIVPPEE